MEEYFGDFIEIKEENALEQLTLRFLPSSVPLQQRWRNNGLSADFLADYVTTFFPKLEEDPESVARYAEIKGAVNYVANELLENAMKYSSGTVPRPIVIHLQLFGERIIFCEANTTAPEQANRFRIFIERLSQSDPMEFYVQQLEANAAEEGNHSGLGLLTMINDYSAQLAWKYVVLPDGDITITTQVIINI